MLFETIFSHCVACVLSSLTLPFAEQKFSILLVNFSVIDPALYLKTLC